MRGEGVAPTSAPTFFKVLTAFLLRQRPTTSTLAVELAGVILSALSCSNTSFPVFPPAPVTSTFIASAVEAAASASTTRRRRHLMTTGWRAREVAIIGR